MHAAQAGEWGVLLSYLLDDEYVYDEHTIQHFVPPPAPRPDPSDERNQMDRIRTRINQGLIDWNGRRQWDEVYYLAAKADQVAVMARLDHYCEYRWVCDGDWLTVEVLHSVAMSYARTAKSEAAQRYLVEQGNVDWDHVVGIHEDDNEPELILTALPQAWLGLHTATRISVKAMIAGRRDIAELALRRCSFSPYGWGGLAMIALHSNNMSCLAQVASLGVTGNQIRACINIAAADPGGWSFSVPQILSKLEKARTVISIREDKPMTKSMTSSYAHVESSMDHIALPDGRTHPDSVCDRDASTDVCKPHVCGGCGQNMGK
jgi:hypothetical protein